MTKTRLFSIVLGLLLVVAFIAVAQRPERDIAPGVHPNLARAQGLIQEAYDAIVAAERDNVGGMGGHAQKAKELLEKANRELKQAAERANVTR